MKHQTTTLGTARSAELELDYCRYRGCLLLLMRALDRARWDLRHAANASDHASAAELLAAYGWPVGGEA